MKAISPQSLFGICGFIRGYWPLLHLLIGPALGVWGGCGDVQPWGDKVEPGEGGREGGRQPGRARRGPGFCWRLLETPGQAYFRPCQQGLSLLISQLGMAKRR